MPFIEMHTLRAGGLRREQAARLEILTLFACRRPAQLPVGAEQVGLPSAVHAALCCGT